MGAGVGRRWAWATGIVSTTLALGCGGSGETQPRYCDVEPILKAHCVRCHSEPPAEGAPFPLTSAAHFQEDYGSRPVFEAAEDALVAEFMPPQEGFTPKPTPLSDADRKTLIEFVRAGAPDCK